MKSQAIFFSCWRLAADTSIPLLQIKFMDLVCDLFAGKGAGRGEVVKHRPSIYSPYGQVAVERYPHRPDRRDSPHFNGVISGDYHPGHIAGVLRRPAVSCHRDTLGNLYPYYQRHPGNVPP